MHTSVCVYAHMCVQEKEREAPTDCAWIGGTAAGHPPSKSQLGLKSMFPDCWMEFPFIQGCVISTMRVFSLPHDYLTLLLTPLNTQMQFYFPALGPFSKRSSSCLLVSMLFQINTQRGRALCTSSSLALQGCPGFWNREGNSGSAFPG